MSKLIEAAAEFLARDTSTKHNHEEISEAMHSMKKKMEAMHSMSPMKKKMEDMHSMSPMKKKMEAMHSDGMHRMPDGTMMKNSDHKKKMAKKEMDESFLLSQEEFQSLSEEEREEYINQLMELKHNMMKTNNKMGKKNKMM